MSPVKKYNPEDVEAERKKRIAAICAMQKQLGMETDTLRCLMLNVTGKASRKDMSLFELTRVRDELVKKGGKLRPTGRKLDVAAESKKLRALWLRGHELGIIKSPDEAALCSWASNSRSPNVTASLAMFTGKQFYEAIERLKKWLFREIMAGQLVCSGCGHQYVDFDKAYVKHIIKNTPISAGCCPTLTAIAKWQKRRHET